VRKLAGRLFWWILEFKPGSAFWIVSLLLLFIGMAVFTQYQMTGKVNVSEMINRDVHRQYFWDRNPDIEYRDSFPNTSLVMVRDRQSGLTAMLDMAVVQSARIRASACTEPLPISDSERPPGATGILCFAIEKPDTGAGDRYIFASAWSAKGKQSQVGQFYRELFGARGLNVTRIQDSSRATILEAEDEHHDTVARVSIRASFDISQIFLAVTDGFAAYRH